MLGFAANSLLARQALGHGEADPTTYTLVRLASGAALLAVLLLVGQRHWRGTWTGGAALAVYAAAFSFSYVRIGAALGALILFPTIKLALLGWGVSRGERPPALEWTGAGLALGGLALLTWPGQTHADAIGVVLMIAAGLAWAVYTASGTRAADPLEATASNFVRALVIASPLVLVVGPAALHTTLRGLVLAVASGAIASALAYLLWYSAVPRLSTMQMGLAQLTVPAIAAAGAVLLLGEPLTGRLVMAGLVILSGVGLALRRGR